MLVVNTDERWSERNGTPCSPYLKLTLGEGSPGSLDQWKPRDELDPIRHSPTPAQELDPHPVPGWQPPGAESLDLSLHLRV